ncbi:hypothetical protein C0J52_25223 [Blattella germanica]|nr:hypothetical protein C0J52_25223 [Blattella germanica]
MLEHQNFVYGKRSSTAKGLMCHLSGSNHRMFYPGRGQLNFLDQKDYEPRGHGHRRRGRPLRRLWSAADLIRSIPVTDVDYKTAIQMLRDRYDRPDRTVKLHVAAIFELEENRKIVRNY